MDTFAHWLWTTSVAVSLLIGLILLIRRPVARLFGPRAAYALWALPIIRVVLPPIHLPALPVPSLFQTATTDPVSMQSPPLDVTAIVNSAHLSAAQATHWDWSMTGFVIWIMGATIMLGALTRAQIIFHRTLMETVEPVPTAQQARIVKILSEMNLSRMPRIRICETRNGPLVSGLFRPVILLPRHMLDDRNATLLRHALWHECAHVWRGDLYSAAVANVLRAALWFNPLMPMAWRAFRSDQEAACDATVLDSLEAAQTERAAYAETLLQSARLARADSPSHLSPSLALTLHHPLKERLMTLTQTPRLSRRMSALGTTAIMLGASLLSAPLTFADDHPDTPQTDTQQQSRSVYKWIEDDGVKTHYEVEIEDGVVKAWSIDEDGVRTPIDPNMVGEVEVMDTAEMWDDMDFDFDFDFDFDEDMLSAKQLEKLSKLEELKSLEQLKALERLEDMNVVIRRAEDGKNRMRILRRQMELPQSPMPPLPPEPPFPPSAVKAQLSSAQAMVKSAERMLQRAESRNMDAAKLRKAERKLREAEKALKELEAEFDQ